ncbi:MAG: hypothetical protein Q4D41_02335 [Prevotellaceae bacterium]|nr:hypothetical protein [Prevotellaceae bacterium]
MRAQRGLRTYVYIPNYRHRRWRTLLNRYASDSVACGFSDGFNLSVPERGELSLTAIRATAWLEALNNS